jgi:hypothetical protein
MTMKGERMGKATMTTLRLPMELLERADALIPALSHHATASASGELVRSDVLRLALLRGLTELERETSRGQSREQESAQALNRRTSRSAPTLPEVLLSQEGSFPT